MSWKSCISSLSKSTRSHSLSSACMLTLMPCQSLCPVDLWTSLCSISGSLSSRLHSTVALSVSGSRPSDGSTEALMLCPLCILHFNLHMRRCLASSFLTSTSTSMLLSVTTFFELLTCLSSSMASIFCMPDFEALVMRIWLFIVMQAFRAWAFGALHFTVVSSPTSCHLGCLFIWMAVFSGMRVS